MSKWVGIEELQLSPSRPPGPLPKVSLQRLNLIREHGVIDPVVVRRLGPHQFEILSNPETWLAIQRVGGNKVPIIEREGVDELEAADIVRLAYQPRIQDPLEEAESLQQLLDELGGRGKRGATRLLAERTGLSRTYVSHALRLLELPAQIQAMIRNGRLHAGHAKPLVAIKNRRLQLQLAQKIANERLSVRTAESLARKVRAGQSFTSRDSSKDSDIIRLETRLTELTGCSVRINSQRGELVIDYEKELEVLDGILQRLGYSDE